MVTPREREHFRLIAAAEQELQRESIEAAAARTPGENIALGFELSELAAAFGADLTRDPELSPASLWRSRGGGSQAER